MSQVRTGLAAARHAVWSCAASCCAGTADLPSPAGAMASPLARVNARPAPDKQPSMSSHVVPSPVLSIQDEQPTALLASVHSGGWVNRVQMQLIFISSTELTSTASNVHTLLQLSLLIRTSTHPQLSARDEPAALTTQRSSNQPRVPARGRGLRLAPHSRAAQPVRACGHHSLSCNVVVLAQGLIVQRAAAAQ